MPGHPHLALVALVAIVGVGTAACGGDGDAVQSDAERFCGEAIARRDTIVSPPLSTEAELEATLEFYRLMGDLAPVAIAEEWNVLVETIETASTVVPGDRDSEQRVAMQAYASEPAAYAVKVWLERNCGLDIPITTIAPHDVVPAPAPSLPAGASTPSSPAPTVPAGASTPSGPAPTDSTPSTPVPTASTTG